MKIPKKAVLLFVIISVVSANQALAQRPAGPPPEAITACAGKQAGDQAEFTGRQGETVTGTCQAGKDGTLFLKPDHPPQQGQQRGQQRNRSQQGAQGQRPAGPPPEALAACKGKQEGDQAEFTGRQGETVSGTCQAGKDGTLFLKPDHPPEQAAGPNK